MEFPQTEFDKHLDRWLRNDRWREARSALPAPAESNAEPREPFGPPSPPPAPIEISDLFCRDRRQSFTGYILVDPRSDEVRYVGVTRNPSERRHEHRRPKLPHLRPWIESLRADGFDAEFRLLWEEDLTPQEARTKEAEWIAAYLRAGEPLLNRLSLPVEESA